MSSLEVNSTSPPVVVVVEDEKLASPSKLKNEQQPTTSSTGSTTDITQPLDDETRKKVEEILGKTPIVLLIKGEADRPFCKFSKRIVSLLISRGIQFSSFDVKSLDQNDEAQKKIYMGFKKYGNFPTIPQLYVNKELVGGLDICLGLDEENQLISSIKELLPKDKHQACIAEDLSRSEFSKITEIGQEAVQINIRYMNGVVQKFILNSARDTVEKLYEAVLLNFSKFDSQFKKPFLIAYPGIGKKILDRNYLHNTILECFSKDEFEQDLHLSRECCDNQTKLKIIPLTIYYLPSATLALPPPKPKLDPGVFMLKNVFGILLKSIFKRPFDFIQSTWGSLFSKKWW